MKLQYINSDFKKVTEIIFCLTHVNWHWQEQALKLYKKNSCWFNTFRALSIKKNFSKQIDKRFIAENIEIANKWLSDPQHHLLIYGSESYPENLYQLDQPPLALYVIGDKALLKHLQVSIVGARLATLYGLKVTENFVEGLVAANIVITSGMALGIDTAGHEAALKFSGKTIAVLGSGVNKTYPKRNQKLYEQITTNGAVVSEFALNTPAEPQNFPRRNRIIAALSNSTCVIEAKIKSGSLHTAYFAIDLGKNVYAVPGPITSEMSAGCHKLITEGALLATNWGDLLESEIITTKKVLSDSKNDKNSTKNNISHEYSEILRYITFSASSFEDILTQTALSVSELKSKLVQLEIDGLITKHSLGYYRLK